MLLKSKAIQKLAGGRLERWGSSFISFFQFASMGAHKDPALLKMLKQSRRELGGPLATEGFLLYSLVRAQRTLPGDFAEVGVFRGGSARIICEAMGDKRLHLFDTFAGLPEGSSVDDGVFKPNQYNCSLETVRQTLSEFPDVHYHQGLFPASIRGVAEVEQAKYAFVHLDVDLYESTKDCLEFFYPRTVPAGLIVSHDFSLLDGVRNAFEEFFADKPEDVIELPTTQCMVIKRG